MFREWYSKENDTITHLFTRMGTWMASDVVGEIRDRIYLLPTFMFYINHSSWYFGFRWLTLKLDFYRENFRKRDEYIRKIRCAKENIKV